MADRGRDAGGSPEAERDEDGDAVAAPQPGGLAAWRQARAEAYDRIEEALFARAEGEGGKKDFDPALALNLLKMRRPERPADPAGTRTGGGVTHVPIGVVIDALLRRLSNIARQEGG